MAHFIVRVDNMLDPATDKYVDGVFYAYHRRSTGRMYERETHFGPDLDQARVFTTKVAASNAMRGFYVPEEMEIIPVQLTLADILDLAKGKPLE